MAKNNRKAGIGTWQDFKIFQLFSIFEAKKIKKMFKNPIVEMILFFCLINKLVYQINSINKAIYISKYI